MNLLEESKQGNPVYRLNFPGGKRISFRLLTWKRFNDYWGLMQRGTISNTILEDAIFKECVLDNDDIEQMHSMLAGIIATVAMVIMRMSGPSDLEAFMPDLEVKRIETSDLRSQITMTICRAFPAYTPETIELLPWPKVLLRLAQAESILLESNPPQLQGPMQMLSPEEVKKQHRTVSGQANANELVLEGKKAAAAIRGEEPGQLTPTQLAQIEKINELKKRRQRK